MKSLYVIMGVPGSGKDTQAELLESNHGFKVIRIGHLIRELAKHNDSLNRIQKHGDLADEKLVNNLMSKALDDQPQESRILSDGFPRSLSQAKDLEEMCKTKNIDLVKVIYLHISFEESMKRLKLRARIDDTDETIKNRLDIFSQKTVPVIDYFKSKGILCEVDGAGEIDEIQTRILGVLK